MNLVSTVASMYRILQAAFRRTEKFSQFVQFASRQIQTRTRSCQIEFPDSPRPRRGSQAISTWLDPSVAGFNKERDDRAVSSTVRIAPFLLGRAFDDRYVHDATDSFRVDGCWSKERKRERGRGTRTFASLQRSCQEQKPDCCPEL